MTSKNRLQRLWDRLSRKKYRDAFVEEHINSGVAVQIHENRIARGMNQLEMGKLLGVTQGRISRLENPDCGTPNLKTLVRIASAFDCGLLVKFVPFSELARWAISAPEEPAAVTHFAEDSISTAQSSTETIAIELTISQYPVFAPAVHGPSRPIEGFSSRPSGFLATETTAQAEPRH